MHTTILDTITAAFVDALQTGAGALAQYSLPLLGVFALIAFYVQVGPLVASGGAGVGDALASILLTAVKTGVFYWLLVNLNAIATAAFLTFLQWGITPGEWPPLSQAASSRAGSGMGVAWTAATGCPRLSHCWASQPLHS